MLSNRTIKQAAETATTTSFAITKNAKVVSDDLDHTAPLQHHQEHSQRNNKANQATSTSSTNFNILLQLPLQP